MGIVLLRKMTMKSIIGFGINPELTVQEFCQLNMHSKLIDMYYNLDRIDFDDEVKLCLRIVGEDRIIKKLGKDYNVRKRHIFNMIEEIMEREGTKFKEGEFVGSMAKKMHSGNVSVSKRKIASSEFKMSNRSYNRSKNQW